LTTFSLALLMGFGLCGMAGAQQRPKPLRTFDGLLDQMSSGPANPCDGTGENYSDLEYQLFGQADKAVIQELNNTSAPDGDNPRTRTLRAIAELEHLSAEINNGWPEDKRFHAEVLEIPPAIVVKMTYRNRAAFSFFAIPERDPFNRPTKLWQPVGALDDGRYEPKAGYVSLDLFALERGPSKRARFLAKFGGAGCGSGVGVGYYVYEWNPQDTGNLDELIKVEGAVSQEDPIRKQPSSKKRDLSSFFPTVGELQAKGPIIDLPYCWFSAIDTWDNPSLCTVDSYDISGDRVRFRSRVTNRTDLVPIAKAIEHAQAHEYAAVLAYCGSPGVASQMLRDVPPFLYSDASLKVTRIGDGKERVELGDSGVRFDVEKRGNRWLVVAFHID